MLDASSPQLEWRLQSISMTGSENRADALGRLQHVQGIEKTSIQCPCLPDSGVKLISKIDSLFSPR